MGGTAVPGGAIIDGSHGRPRRDKSPNKDVGGRQRRERGGAPRSGAYIGPRQGHDEGMSCEDWPRPSPGTPRRYRPSGQGCGAGSDRGTPSGRRPEEGWVGLEAEPMKSKVRSQFIARPWCGGFASGHDKANWQRRSGAMGRGSIRPRRRPMAKGRAELGGTGTVCADRCPTITTVSARDDRTRRGRPRPVRYRGERQGAAAVVAGRARPGTARTIHRRLPPES